MECRHIANLRGGVWETQIDYTKRVYATDAASPALTTQSEGVWGTKILMREGEMDCKQIASLEGDKWAKMHEQSSRVYSPEAASPSLVTVAGGGKM